MPRPFQKGEIARFWLLASQSREPGLLLPPSQATRADRLWVSSAPPKETFSPLSASEKR